MEDDPELLSDGNLRRSQRSTKKSERLREYEEGEGEGESEGEGEGEDNSDESGSLENFCHRRQVSGFRLFMASERRLARKEQKEGIESTRERAAIKWKDMSEQERIVFEHRAEAVLAKRIRIEGEQAEEELGIETVTITFPSSPLSLSLQDGFDIVVDEATISGGCDVGQELALVGDQVENVVGLAAGIDDPIMANESTVDEPAANANPAAGRLGQKFCSDCQIEFDTLPKLKYHRLKTHGKWQAGFKCPECSKTLGSTSNLRRHLRDFHGSGPLASRDDDGRNGKSSACSVCGYVPKDNFHLNVHMRKHTGERPHVCPQCTFGFYKKSDLTVHLKRCRGVKHQCAACKKVFHFKKQWQEHKLWSKTCGVMEEKTGNAQTAVDDDAAVAGPSRYMSEKPSMFRLNISREQSVVGVNCENLIDETQFSKRKRRARCGLCEGCERTENCDICRNCAGAKVKKTCEKRLCLNLVEQYDVKTLKEHEGEGTLLDAMMETETKLSSSPPPPSLSEAAIVFIGEDSMMLMTNAATELVSDAAVN